jgi:hypothetical protein
MTTTTWFATQVDRDFLTKMYGNGTRLYMNGEYNIITGVSYENNVLIVKDSNGDNIELTTEPDNIKFTNTLYNDWKNWDSSYGKYEDEDRSDYEPFAYDSMKSLANELNLTNENVEMYYNPN